MKSWIVLSILAFLAPGKSYATSKGKPTGDADSYRLVQIEDQRDGRNPYLKDALTGKNSQLTANDPSTLPLIEKNLQHPVRNVVVKAAEAWQKISGKILEKALPRNSRVIEATPPLARIEKALESEIVLETSKGIVRLVMELIRFSLR